MSDGSPPLDEFSDQELAEALASQFMANKLRRWMSANGLERSRGANKLESAMQAVEQDRDGIAEYLFQINAIDVDWEPKCMHYEACGNRTAGAGADVCDRCMDLARRADRERGTPDRGDFDSAVAYFERLYELYD